MHHCSLISLNNHNRGFFYYYLVGTHRQNDTFLMIITHHHSRSSRGIICARVCIERSTRSPSPRLLPPADAGVNVLVPMLQWMWQWLQASVLQFQEFHIHFLSFHFSCPTSYICQSSCPFARPPLKSFFWYSPHSVFRIFIVVGTSTCLYTSMDSLERSALTEHYRSHIHTHTHAYTHPRYPGRCNTGLHIGDYDNSILPTLVEYNAIHKYYFRFMSVVMIGGQAFRECALLYFINMIIIIHIIYDAMYLMHIKCARPVSPERRQAVVLCAAKWKGK